MRRILLTFLFSCLFLGLSLTADDGRKPCRIPFCAFGEEEGWFFPSSLKHAKVTTEKKYTDVLVGLRTPGKNDAAELRDHRFYRLPFGTPQAIELEAEVISGKRVNLLMTFTDADKKTIVGKERWVEPGKGRQILHWDLPGDLKKAPKLPLTPNTILINQPGYAPEDLGVLRFHQIYIIDNRTAPEAITMKFTTPRRLAVCLPGEESHLGLEFTCYYPAAADVKIHVDLKHPSGLTRTYDETVHFAGAGTTYVLPLKWTSSLPYGVWQATVTMTDVATGSQTVSTRPSFAWMKPAGPITRENPEFILGMNPHQQVWSILDRRTEAEASMLAGGMLLRTGYEWTTLQHKPGIVNWKPLDDLVEDNAKAHQAHLNCIGFTPKFAAPPERQKSKKFTDWNRAKPNDEVADFYHYELAKRYKGKITFYEIWNEPDLNNFWSSSQEEYFEYLKVASQAIRRGNPDAKIISGGLAGFLTIAKKDMYKNMAKYADYYDYYGFHRHGDFVGYEKDMKRLQQELGDLLKKRPLFMTETGDFASQAPSRRLRQAFNVVAKIIFARRMGARGYIWYDIREDGFRPDYHEHQYGIFTNEWFAKDAYVAFNTVNLLTQDASFDGILMEQEGFYAYRFLRPNGDTVVVVWKANAKIASRPIVFAPQGAAVEVYDTWGNATPLPSGDRVPFTPGDMPSFLVFHQPKAPVALAQGVLKMADSYVVLIPGREKAFVLEVTNPGKARTAVRLSVTNTPKLTATVAPSEVVLNPNETRQVKLTLNPAEDFKEEKVSVHYAIGQEKGGISFQAGGATKLPKAFSAQPQFVLNTAANYHSTMEYNPATAHRIWKGPEDQAVKIWLAVGAETFDLKVQVVDDVHTLSKSAAKSYVEDGIQFAIVLPGQTGYWELGACELEDHTGGSACWLSPVGKTPLMDFPVTVEHDGTTTTYTCRIPRKHLGLTEAALRQGFQFNILVNENDGEGRDGWMFLAPGLADNKNPEYYPFVVGE